MSVYICRRAEDRVAYIYKSLINCRILWHSYSTVGTYADDTQIYMYIALSAADMNARPALLADCQLYIMSSVTMVLLSVAANLNPSYLEVIRGLVSFHLSLNLPSDARAYSVLARSRFYLFFIYLKHYGKGTSRIYASKIIKITRRLYCVEW